MVNILNIVPTIESYILLLIALFIYFELFEDHFKKIILKNLLDKLLDFSLFELLYYLQREVYKANLKRLFHNRNATAEDACNKRRVSLYYTAKNF